MPMNLAVLTLEKNWRNQRISLNRARCWEEALCKGFDVGQILHAPPNLALLSTYWKHGWNKGRDQQHPVSLWSKIRIASISKTLPLELNDSTLSSSCLKAVLPLSMLRTAWEAVVSRLFLWEKHWASEQDGGSLCSAFLIAASSVRLPLDLNVVWKKFSFWIRYIQLDVAVSASEKEKAVQSCLRVQICWKKSLACSGLSWKLQANGFWSHGKNDASAPFLTTDWSCGSWLCSEISVRQTRRNAAKSLCMVNFDVGILLKTLRRPRGRLTMADLQQLWWLQGWKDGHDRWSQSQDSADFDQCIWDPRIAHEILWTKKKPAVCRL